MPVVAMIPQHIASGVLPPHLGSPAVQRLRAPYRATMLELVTRFATSPARIEILRGFFAYRRDLAALGFVSGFQWVAGSFTEALVGREPGDIDVVTIYDEPAGLRSDDALRAKAIDLFDAEQTQLSYRCDAYGISLTTNDPRGLVRSVHYWYGLWSHRKVTQEWKGFLEVPLGHPGADDEASARLDAVKAP